MNPKDKIHSSWLPFLTDVLEKDELLKELNTKVLPNVVHFPKNEDIFNVFEMPLQNIKVVILGQDPYPTEGNAIGYAFAVNEDINKPASLRIIEKEVGHDIDKTLKTWRDQGVFLLNTALTVQSGKAGSHLNYWKDFTTKVISHISQQNPCIWILWGKKAQEYRAFINKPSVLIVNGKNIPVLQPGFNYVLTAPHPAAEAYSGGTAGFLGCNHFNQVNEILKNTKKELIKF